MIFIVLAIYLTAGFPDFERSLQALNILKELKVDVIELGVPFSDPLADGPVIQNSSHQALTQGMNLDKVFDLVAQAGPFKNIILFSYFNPMFQYGLDKVISKCKECGVHGILVPDLPVSMEEKSEAQNWCNSFKENGLELILLAALTSSEQRLKQIAQLSNPWIYLVSRIGVTGSQQEISSLTGSEENQDQNTILKEKINSLKAMTDKKIGLGFGIDSAKKVQESYEIGADMAIIGSKAIKILEKDKTKDLSEFKEFILSLKKPSFVKQ